MSSAACILLCFSAFDVIIHSLTHSSQSKFARGSQVHFHLPPPFGPSFHSSNNCFFPSSSLSAATCFTTNLASVTFGAAAGCGSSDSYSAAAATSCWCWCSSSC